MLVDEHIALSCQSCMRRLVIQTGDVIIAFPAGLPDIQFSEHMVDIRNTVLPALAGMPKLVLERLIHIHLQHQIRISGNVFSKLVCTLADILKDILQTISWKANTL